MEVCSSSIIVMTKKQTMIIGGVVLIITGILSRLMDHPANFVPITAIALVSGYYWKSRWSWLMVLTAVFLSDIFLGFYNWQIMVTVYASYLIIWLSARWAMKSDEKFAIVPTVLLSSLIFFFATNCSVWLFSGLYPHTIDGFYTCFVMALPFFKWSLASDILFTSSFFGIIELFEFAVKKSQKIGKESANFLLNN